MNDNGDLIEVEFAAEVEQEEIEEWRMVDLSQGQEARLEALAGGPEALAKRLGVGLRRGQQRIKEEFQRLADELAGQGQQMDLWGASDERHHQSAQGRAPVDRDPQRIAQG